MTLARPLGYLHIRWLGKQTGRLHPWIDRPNTRPDRVCAYNCVGRIPREILMLWSWLGKAQDGAKMASMLIQVLRPEAANIKVDTNAQVSDMGSWSAYRRTAGR